LPQKDCVDSAVIFLVKELNETVSLKEIDVEQMEEIDAVEQLDELERLEQLQTINNWTSH